MNAPSLPNGLALLAAIATCGAALASPPPFEVSESWEVVERSEDVVVFRYRDSAHGVRINLRPGPRGRVPGVAPILHGKTWEVHEGERLFPLFAMPYADREPRGVEIRSQGPDLFIELRGPPLGELVDHPEAPDDPVLSRLRIRPRPGSWKIIAQGLHLWSFPAQDLSLHQLGDARTLSCAWGVVHLQGRASGSRSLWTPDRLWIDTTPSAAAFDPYPTLELTVPLSP